ncbi:MAG: NB-ARC domain-containing protein, partial [Saprospiraceae bacterium]
MTTHQLFNHIRELIAQDQMQEAMAALRTLVENTPRLNELVQQSGRLENVLRQLRLGIVSHEDAALEQNRIRYGVLELLSEIEKQQIPDKTALGDLLAAVEAESGRPEVQGEFARAVSIVQSKNVVVNSVITAGGNVHIGDIITYSDGRKIPRLLTNRPSPPDYFIGRDEDLQAIAKQIQNDTQPLVLVNGEGGIGKTTLAAKFWHQHEARYKHLAWMFAEQGIGSALLRLAPSLGVQFDPTDDETVQTDKILSAIANLENPCLLVFDNANEAADLRKHYQRLKGLTNCHILLTSRVAQVGAMKTYAIQPLTEEQGIELFRYHCPELKDEELPLLRAILKAVGYNTLATELLAKNLTVLNKNRKQYTLENLLHDLQGKGLLAVKNKAVETTYHSDELRSATPTEIIAAMYDLAKLTEDERYLLSNLAVLPADYLTFELLEGLLGMDTERLEDALDSLQEKGWLDFNANDKTYKTSPVIQEVTKAQNAQRLLTDCRALVNTLTEGLNDDNRHNDNYRQA